MPWDNFGDPFGLPWAPWGAPGSLWPSFGVPLAVLGHLWDPFGTPWVTLWRLLDFVENLMSFSEQMWRFLDTVVQNQASPDSPAVPLHVTSARQSGVRNRCSDPMSTRAGG